VAFAALAPALVSLGERASVTAIAAGLGGVLLAYRALSQLAIGLTSLIGLSVAWRQMAPLHEAGGIVEPPVAPDIAVGEAPTSEEHRPTDAALGLRPIVEARGVVFRYRSAGEPVLRGTTLVLR